VNTAEDDVLRCALFGSSLRQFKRIAGDVSKLNNLITLVMMAQDHYS
jgi:hypothetical protein